LRVGAQQTKQEQQKHRELFHKQRTISMGKTSIGEAVRI